MCVCVIMCDCVCYLDPFLLDPLCAGQRSVGEGGSDVAATLKRNTSLIDLDLRCE